MAQILANKIPIDSNPRKAVGFGFPINGDAVFVPTYTTRDQIKANLVNYLLTNRGERVFNPNYGANLRAQVFEIINEDNLDNLGTSCQRLCRIKFNHRYVLKQQMVYNLCPPLSKQSVERSSNITMPM